MKLKENVDSKKVVDIINRVTKEIADKKLGITTKTFYRVSHPEKFLRTENCKTLAEAEEYILEMKEKANIWMDKKIRDLQFNRACELYIERVTEKSERLQ